MDKTLLASLVGQLAVANRQPGTLIPGDDFASLSAEDAIAVQAGVLYALDDTAPIAKVGKDTAGRGIVAPILGSRCIASGETLPLPRAGFLGIEVEIAARFKRDITAEIAAQGDAAIADCIEGYVLGIELVATRFADRTKAGAYGPLADNMTGAGYIVGDAWPSAEIEGISIVVDMDGVKLFSGPAKHPFGGVIAAIRNYALAPFDLFGSLKAGMVMTTGTLCGLVVLPGPGVLNARVGEAGSVKVTLS